ncbi:MAG: hypothetical protein R2865_01875 [Deinococcales bacterium]
MLSLEPSSSKRLSSLIASVASWTNTVKSVTASLYRLKDIFNIANA